LGLGVDTNATVAIRGDVIGGTSGVSVFLNSSVTVGGSITTVGLDGIGGGRGIVASESIVNVSGDVTAENGVYIYKNTGSEVTVDGDFLAIDNIEINVIEGLLNED
jgi:hypothetical protein